MSRYRSVAIGIVSLAAILLTVPVVASAGVLTNGQWIAKSRVLVPGSPPFEDGAVSQHPKAPLETISPYWGNYAAVGLANAGGSTKVALALDWLKWYRKHVKNSGVISQYRLDPEGTDPETYLETAIGSETDVNTVSPAAYASSFLLAMWEYRSASGPKKLKSFKKQIRYSAFLLLNQQDAADGLIWSHPNGTAGRMKSLITQAESYAALHASVTMLNDLGYARASGLAAAAATAIKTGVDALWLPAVGAYATLKDETGALHVTDWSTWYADAVAQGWIVAAGNGLNPGADLVDPTRARQLMGTLIATWPEWNRPGFRPSFGRVAGTASGLIGYQPMIGVALTEVGATKAAKNGVTNINDYAIGKARKWPFTVGNAGQIMLTLGSV